jgi:hypothetical protein
MGARFHFRGSREPVISFTPAFRPKDRVLVLMPLFEPDERVALTFLGSLGTRFRQEQMTVVTPGPQLTINRALPRAGVIALNTRDLSLFFLPRRPLLERLRGRTFDAAIDLNLDFNLPSGYIGRECNARVRAGFAGPSADLFYNLQVRIDPSTDREHAYARLAQCLQMFSGQEGV